jgi:hypothetical protein
MVFKTNVKDGYCRKPGVNRHIPRMVTEQEECNQIFLHVGNRMATETI